MCPGKYMLRMKKEVKRHSMSRTLSDSCSGVTLLLCVCLSGPEEPGTTCWPTPPWVCVRLKAASSPTPSSFSKMVRDEDKEM